MAQDRSNTSTEPRRTPEPQPSKPLKDPAAPVSADDWLPEEDQKPSRFARNIGRHGGDGG